MTSTGIPIAALDFYEDLQTDNSEAFWAAHKQVLRRFGDSAAQGTGRRAR